jgi:hypothetical protein
MFVPPAAHSHEAPRVREASRPLSGRVKEWVVTAGAAPVGVTCLALTIYSASTAFQRDPLGQVVNRDHLPGMPADQASKWSSPHNAHLP